MRTHPITLLNPNELFDAYVHIECARSAGIKNAEHWLIFAFEEDYDHAYVFDDRFGNNEYAIGFYHQDDVCENPASSKKRLPQSCDNFAEWYEKHRDSMVEETLETFPQPGGETDEWISSNWRRAFRETADLAIVKNIIEEVRIPIVQKAKVTGIRGPAYLYPQPLDLLYRLAPERRRDLAREILKLSGVPHKDEKLESAEESLNRKCENPENVTVEETREHLINCSEIAWPTREWLNHPSQKKALYARALLWALGTPDPERIWEAMLLVMRLDRIGPTHTEAQKYGLVPPLTRHLDSDFIWEKLEALVLKNAQRPRTDASDYQIFVRWIHTQQPNRQTNTWMLIKKDWAQKLEQLNEDEKRDVISVIKKVIKHNGLILERDAFLKKLA